MDSVREGRHACGRIWRWADGERQRHVNRRHRRVLSVVPCCTLLGELSPRSPWSSTMLPRSTPLSQRTFPSLKASGHSGSLFESGAAAWLDQRPSDLVLPDDMPERNEQPALLHRSARCVCGSCTSATATFSCSPFDEGSCVESAQRRSTHCSASSTARDARSASTATP